MRTDSWRLAGALIAALAVLMLAFSGVYSGARGREPERVSERRQTVSLDPDQGRQPRRIIPLHLLDERTAPLNRETPFIATKENPWSGQNAEETKSWAEARPLSGDLSQEQASSSSAAPLPADEDLFFPVDDAAFARTRYGRMLQSEGLLSPFQELPQELRPDSSLLVHFDSRGRISLGALAEKNAEYFHAMVRKISQQWNIHFPRFQHFYGLLKGGAVLITFELDLDGVVGSVRVVQSYGQPAVDESCVRAIQAAGTFGPIPREYREQGKLIIPFVFVYQRPEHPLKMFH